MSNTAIKIENISKLYRLGEVGTGTLGQDLNRWWAKIRGKEDPYAKIGQVNDRSKKAESDFVWSLKDINLEVQQGEVLGIIGKNGAGKSTLLKLISQITSPTTGSIKAKGRIASLLEVGTGMNPELTARENIYLNGAILGMTKKEIDRKFDEIVDFSGCAMYIDTPIKRFSSGMSVRLGFAVAAFLEPEILIVDEVLAVGDAEFQKRAIGKMKEVSEGGKRTVLFVSHNMPSVLELCTRAILLKNGEIFKIGDTPSIVNEYLNLSRSEITTSDLSTIKNRQGNGKIKFNRIRFFNKIDEEVDFVTCGEDIKIVLNLKVNLPSNYDKIHVSIKVVDSNERPYFHISNSIANTKEFSISELEEEFSIQFQIPKLPLNEGQYFLNLFVSDLFEEMDVINFSSKLIVKEGNFYKGKLPSSKLSPFLIQYNCSKI